MSYKCQICGRASKAGAARAVWTVHRTRNGRQEIEREVTVCTTCADDLEAGVPLHQLIGHYGHPVSLPTAPPVASGRSVLRRG